MPTIPAIRPTLKEYSTVGIINSIIDNTTELEGVPHVKNTTESIRMVGEIITGYAPRANAFANALVNRIGMTRLHYMLFTNPWSWAKQGKLEMGETVEQIWIDLAKAFPYNQAQSETTFMKRVKPDIQTAFHSINYQEVYKITISDYDLQKAFLSVNAMQDLIERIIGSIARAVTLDEFMLMKYLIAVLLLEGKIATINVPAIDAANANSVITTVTTLTNNFQFPSTEYNMAGVYNTTPIDDLYIIETTSANAHIKVNSLAAAYNVDYVKFMGHVVMVDSFGKFDWNRMDMLFAEDSGYSRFTTAQISLLESVQMIAMDRQFMQIYDAQEFMATPFINGEGAYTNYPYHVSKIASASPFHNCVAFATATNSVTSVTLSPTAATVDKGLSYGFQAIVSTQGFASSDIVWEITSAVTDSSIAQTGIITVGANETAATITVRATSVFDETKYGEATVTVGPVVPEPQTMSLKASKS